MSRERLLEVARERFANVGYEAVGVAAICDAAGVTKPTLYHHFGSKRGLLEAVVNAHSAMLLGRLEPLTSHTRESLPGDEIKLMLDRITETMWQFAVEHPDFYRLFLSSSTAPPGTDSAEVIRPLRQQLWCQLRDLFVVAAFHHGAFRKRHEPLAHTFLGMVHTWIGLYLAGDATLDAPTRYRAVHGYLHGIFS